MSKLSIYETKWTDLVFENKNKEYGAYQLRQESAKNSITALFGGLLVIASLGTASMLISKFKKVDVTPIPTDIPISDPLIVTQVDLTHEVTPPPPPPTQQTAATQVTEAVQLTNPVVVAASQAAVEEIAPNTVNAPVVTNTTGNGIATTNVLPSTGNGTGVTPSVPNTNEPVLATALDKMPEFPGGMAKFYTFVGNNFQRPELDAERTLRVYVSFVVEKDGSLTDIMVKNDPGYGMGREAVRVLKSLKTKWTPGILNGKAVRTAYNLPITIKTEAE
ncbi:MULTISPECIES: energy transducer TonB [Flavobacterium]|uniref:Energy transducer TonB n=1 Tax=Flavobacterium cupriresistens TaxID=2893885 RepID=A0ABU4RHI0_9FLAO|nr:MULTISPECIES: energy transducer TonB [unclassified Flavobacterium]KLT70965.1 energy transducer TonB [Flavobacterium sp. ABG]MDX6190006.1 energy transducer TonB [Flavobacterium sp. Fl-318]UFH42830.1 energy transducer TonB [Flavobacterium sp. F-323]